MAISQLFFLSNRGDIIIFRDFRKDLSKKINDTFFRKVNIYKSEEITPPIFNEEGVNFIFLKKNEVYIVIATLDNESPLYYFSILNTLLKVIKDECGIFSEESLRKNYLLIYEIIDEMIDFGYPQLSSTEEIKSFVYNKPYIMMNTSIISPINNIINRGVKSSEYIKKPISQVIEKKTNEIFVDIIEKITVLYNSSGSLINYGIDGYIQMKSYLKNNPSLEIILNDEIKIGNSNQDINYSNFGFITDCNFHPKVQYKNFESTKKLYIIPPDGEFTLMNYRVTNEFSPPFKIYANVDEEDYKIILKIKIQSNFISKYYAGNITLKFNVPKNTNNVFCQIEKKKIISKTDYIESEKMCFWNIGKINGASDIEGIFFISLSDNNIRKAYKELGPITLTFDIPNFNLSKVNIKQLNILTNDKKYNPKKWIRLLTKENSYVIRID
jgi:AP-4 complex subunit mu-1